MAFDPNFRWFQELIIPRNPDSLEFLQFAECAQANDLAVASFSLRGFKSALAPGISFCGFHCWPHLNCRKCCWVHYGIEEPDSLRTWILENFGEFREMQSVRHAKFVATMIIPDGHISSLNSTPKNTQLVLKISALTKSFFFVTIVWLQDVRDFCAEFYRMCLCSRQGNPHCWGPCSSVYFVRSVQRRVI